MHLLPKRYRKCTQAPRPSFLFRDAKTQSNHRQTQQVTRKTRRQFKKRSPPCDRPRAPNRPGSRRRARARKDRIATPRHATPARWEERERAEQHGHLGERGVEHDVCAVLEQRHGDPPHAAARGDGGLDGAGAGGARHARDAHVRLRRGLLLRSARRGHPHLHVVGVQQRHVLHLVAAPARRRRPAAGDGRELQVGHACQARGGRQGTWLVVAWWEWE